MTPEQLLRRVAETRANLDGLTVIVKNDLDGTGTQLVAEFLEAGAKAVEHFDEVDQEEEMKTYIVERRCVYVEKCEVEARSEDHARRLVSMGEEEEVLDSAPTNNHMGDPSEWRVTEE